MSNLHKLADGQWIDPLIVNAVFAFPADENNEPRIVIRVASELLIFEYPALAEAQSAADALAEAVNAARGPDAAPDTLAALSTLVGAINFLMAESEGIDGFGDDAVFVPWGHLEDGIAAPERFGDPLRVARAAIARATGGGA